MCQTDRKNGKKKAAVWLKILFLIYLVFLIKCIVFKIPLSEMDDIIHSWRRDVVLEGLSSANFIPFKTIKMYIQYYDLPGLRSFANLFGNILAFVPLGMMLPLLFRSSEKPGIFIGQVLLFVLGIELFQLFSAFGAFDVDDIILNCMGAFTGYVIYQLFFVRTGREEEELKD